MNNGAGGWMMGGMWPLSILFWILIIAAAATSFISVSVISNALRLNRVKL